MAPSTVHLPNGQTLTVTPVFGGLFFKANDLSTHHSVFPPGWTIVLNSEDDEDDHPAPSTAAHTIPILPSADPDAPPRQEQPSTTMTAMQPPQRKHHIHRFRKPSLRNDHLFISSISNPASTEFRPANSPTRQIAMMLWATLWWYFHQPEPATQLTTNASAQTPDEGRPKGEWRVNINREGILKGKHLLPKLERMGLIASEDSSVGLDPDDGVRSAGDGWTRMFVSRKSFWQLDPRIYLFTLSPTVANSPFPSVSPASSRPASPERRGQNLTMTRSGDEVGGGGGTPGALGVLGVSSSTGIPHPLSRHNTPPPPPGPFSSSSHLPTFYPPPPLQWTFTNGVRHPVRPKPSRQGETFYSRYIPSLGQYLSFRVASLSKNPCAHRGPGASAASVADPRDNSIRIGPAIADALSKPARNADAADTLAMSDAELLHKWMNDPRVAHSWGENGPISHQESFLSAGLSLKHSFPVIGCFDGRPFGYFEIYWVAEDRLARQLGGSSGGGSGGGAGSWDRGLHCLVGEQEFRGPHRVRVWLSALVHYCWLADMRTQVVMMEPRVDNAKLLSYCQDVGFFKEREIAFPHKQSNLLKILRDTWEAPAI